MEDDSQQATPEPIPPVTEFVAPDGTKMTPSRLEVIAQQRWTNYRRMASQMLANHLTKNGLGHLDGGFSGFYSEGVKSDIDGSNGILVADFVAGRCMSVYVIDDDSKAQLVGMWNERFTPAAAPKSKLWQPGED